MSHQPRPQDLAPSRPIVTEQEVDDALHVLIESTTALARARGRMVRADAMLKHTKAVATAMSGASSFAARENDALASKAYERAIDELAQATIEYEQLKAEREAAVMTIEVFRTIEASRRSNVRL